MDNPGSLSVQDVPTALPILAPAEVLVDDDVTVTCVVSSPVGDYTENIDILQFGVRKRARRMGAVGATSSISALDGQNAGGAALSPWEDAASAMVAMPEVRVSASVEAATDVQKTSGAQSL